MKLVALIFFFLSIFSSAEDSGEKNVEIKPWSAVFEYNELDGFKLTPKAEKNLGVTYMKIEGNSPWLIPESAILSIKHSQAVFRKWNGWTTMVLVKLGKQKEGKVLIKSPDLQSGDNIAVTGLPFLRMTEADLNSDTVDACSH